MKGRFQILLTTSFVLLLGCRASAELSGEEVVVVYNKKVPASEDVARHYAKVRRVPEKQVIGFDLSTNEEIPRSEYESSLAGPLAHELEARGLWQMGIRVRPITNATDLREVRMPVESKIRYVVLCYGMPLKIANDPELHEAGEESVLPALRFNGAAVDSELATLPMPAEIQRHYGLIMNPTYTTTNAAMLSPTNGILMVTRLDGPTPEIAKGLVDKALEAETNGFWGRAYFDIRSITDTNYVIGDEWIRAAYDICHALGFESYLDTNAATLPASFPMSHIAFYAGWYDYAPSGPFTAQKMEFMPGAFAYHLHSDNASTIRSERSGWVGPLLAKGATCTFGSVYEPYLKGTPDVGTFAARWLITGFTFGESAYAAQSWLSWQTTVVGDPLYRPFAMLPQLLHLKLERMESPLLAWEQLRIINLNLERGVPLMRMSAYTAGLPLTKHSAVLMEKLGDLNAALGKPASTLYAYRKALELKTSPQERLRLMLKLGGREAAQKKYADAKATYDQLLKAFPHYPGKAQIEAEIEEFPNHATGKQPALPEVKDILKQTSAPSATHGVGK